MFRSIIFITVKNTCFILVKRSFPSVPIPDAELSLAHDFVSSILKLDKKKRPSAEKIKRHRFLKNIEKGDTAIESDIKYKEKNISKIEASGDGCVNPEAAPETFAMENGKFDIEFKSRVV